MADTDSMRSHRKTWTVLETKSASSGEAIRNVQAQGFETYHPKFREPPVRGVRRIVSLFPRYLFARIEPDNWKPLASTRDVRRVFLLAGGDTPAIVPDAEIERLRSLENSLGYIEPEFASPPKFQVGQSVVGERGLFQDIHGTYLGLAGTSTTRVRVLFEILGQTCPHEMSAFDLAPVRAVA